PADSGQNAFFRGWQQANSIAVPTISLDQVLSPDCGIDLIKIDAEGAEPFLLRGMKEVIARSPGLCILLEFAPVHLRRAGIDPRDFLEEIASLGFDVRRIHDESGELLEVTSDELIAVFSAN